MRYRIGLLVLLLGFACALPAQERPDVLTIVTSSERDTQAMALILTRQVVAGGATARILLCDGAGDLALKGATDGAEVVQPAGASPAGMLRGLRQGGVRVDVCAIYLPNRPLSDTDLEEGIGVARPDDIGALVSDSEVRLFTF